MKVIRIYNQFRRDCYCDLECEACGNKVTNTRAYDDRNYWDNVIPNQKCKKCGKNTIDLGIKNDIIGTKYAEYEVV